MDLGQRLRADIPVREPDPVLLEQLVQLSAAAAQAPASRRALGLRATFVAAGAAVIVSGTAWLAGALPGTVSPLPPFRHHHAAPSHAPSPHAHRHTSTPTAPGTAGSAGARVERSPSDAPATPARHQGLAALPTSSWSSTSSATHSAGSVRATGHGSASAHASHPPSATHSHRHSGSGGSGRPGHAHSSSAAHPHPKLPSQVSQPALPTPSRAHSSPRALR